MAHFVTLPLGVALLTLTGALSVMACDDGRRASATADLDDSNPSTETSADEDLPPVQPCGLAPPERYPALLETHAGEVGPALHALLACRANEVVALTRQLVALQTVGELGRPGANPAFAATVELLSSWAAANGLEFAISDDHDAYEVVLPGSTAERDRLALFIAHIDVVPVNDPPTLVAADEVPEGWTVSPFTAVERDGRLWGRGTEDDKGPIAAALVAIATLAEAGFAPEQAIALVMGTAEETDWVGMLRYVAFAPEARHYVSIDSGFPVTVAESGFVRWGLRLASDAVAAGSEPALGRIVGVEAGLFHTQVPDAAVLELESASAEDASALVAELEAAWTTMRAGDPDFDNPGDPWAVELERPDATHLRVVTRGVSVHSSTPEDGRNALWLLARWMRGASLEPSAETQLLRLIDAELVGDHYGERLGLAYSDPLMGPLSVAPTRLYRADGEVVLEINMRRPQGRDTATFRAALAALVERLRGTYGAELATVRNASVGDPYVADPESETVQVLLDIYRAEMGEPDAGPVSARGSTYARLFPGAVSFGPWLPGTPYRGHGADETIEVALLEHYSRMLLEAMLRFADR